MLKHSISHHRQQPKSHYHFLKKILNRSLDTQKKQRFTDSDIEATTTIKKKNIYKKIYATQT